MRSMKSVTRVIGVTAALVVALTFLPALLPDRANNVLAFGFASVGVLAIKAAWTVALVYIGVRLALRHERGFTNT